APLQEEAVEPLRWPFPGAQAPPLVEPVLRCLCRAWRPDPDGPPGVPALADDGRAETPTGATSTSTPAPLRPSSSSEGNICRGEHFVVPVAMRHVTHCRQAISWRSPHGPAR